MADDTKTDPIAPAITPPPVPKKPRKNYQYWGVYQESNIDATPRGAKQYVEQSAAMISDPTKGAGRTVCIMKAPKGNTLGEATGVCYVNGVRQVTRKKKK